VQVQLHFLPRVEDGLDHAPDRFEAINQGRHRIDEEAGLEAVAREPVELPGHADTGRIVAQRHIGAPIRSAGEMPPRQLRVDRQQDARAHGARIRDASED
jgi:hypothetical protein